MRKNFNAQKYNERMGKLFDKCIESQKKWDYIRQEARKIVDNGNGWGVQCSDMLKIPEQYRTEVWKEIVKIGQEQDREKCSCCEH
jgi:hypothetical protein